MFISIGKVSNYLGVSISSLRRWDNAGLSCPAFRTPGGHRRYKHSEILEISGELEEKNGLVLAYGRVSGHKQKRDLDNQVRCIENYASRHNLHLQKVYSDIASGINDLRPNFSRLLREIPLKRPNKVLITYRDRLSRFGVNVIQLFCKCFDCELIFIKQREEKTLEQELAEG